MLTIAIAAIAAALAAVAAHELMHRRVLRAMEQKAIALKCHFCGCIVARFRQLADGSIQCENCRPKP